MSIETNTAPTATTFDPTTDYLLGIQGGQIVRVNPTALYAEGVIVPNYSNTAGVGGYYIQRANGTPQIVFTMNGSNNLDIGHSSVTYLGIGSSVVLRKNKMFMIESQDISQDLLTMSCDRANNLHIGNDVFTGSTQLGDTYFDVQNGRSQFFTEAAVRVAKLTDSRLGVRPGYSTVPIFANVGGSLFDDYVDVATTHTDGTEDDLYSHTVLADTLGRNGDKLTFSFALTTAGHATATRKIKLYFGGTAFFDSTAQVTAAASVASIEGELVRVSATAVRYRVNASIPGMAVPPQPVYGELTGLALSSDAVFKLAGAAAATGAAGGDVTARMGQISYLPAATVLAFPGSLVPFAWFAADKGTQQTLGGTPAVNNNDPVGAWVDQGLFGRSLLQNTNNNFRPLLKTGYQNGLPAVLFDGANDLLSVATPNYGPVSVYAVMRCINYQNNVFPVAFGEHALYWAAGGGKFYMYGGLVGGGGQSFSAGTTYTFRGILNGASSSTALNGGSPGVGNAGATSVAGLSVGGSPVVGNNASAAVMEVIVFDRILSGGEEADVLSYLRTKWNHY